MKVLHIVDSLHAITPVFIRTQLELLVEAGVKVEVITFGENTESVAKNKAYKVKLIPFDRFGNNRMERAIKWRLYKYDLLAVYAKKIFSQHLNEEIDRFNPDLIHIQFATNALIVWANLNPSNRNRAFIVQFRGYDVTKELNKRHYRNSLSRLLTKKNIATISVASYLYDNLVDRGVPVSNQRVLYSCTDVSFFQRNNKESSRKVFLQISSFREKKGHRYTLQAFKQFLSLVSDAKAYKLILAGGGILLEEMQALSIQLELGDQVFFPGWVNREEAWELMNQADFFVHHSVTGKDGDQEGIPNAIMEAMAMELPVIATRHAGIPELIEDGVHGYLIAERDIMAYAQRMIDILDWPYQKQNREVVAKRFSKKQHVNRLLEIYAEVLS